MTTRPIRVLELRSVRGTGGGPEKTILQGAALADPRFEILICYIRDRRDDVFAIDALAGKLGVRYIEIHERHSFDRSIWPALKALVRDERIDIVHSHEHKTDLLAWMLGRATTAIPLATVHGWTGHSARERFVYYPLDKKVLARFPRLIAVSSQIRDELIRTGTRPERVTTVLNGIDPQAFRRDPTARGSVRSSLGWQADDVVLGAVGRLEPQKRFDLLIDAFVRLRAARPALRLAIVGDGSERPRLEQAVAERQLGAVVQLLGHRTDVSRVHHAFDLFVQSSDYEGTPNAVLEAMALESPVVATAAGGTAELIRDGIDGLIVPAGDVPALVSAIEHALDDRSATAARAASARRRVENELSFIARTRKLEEVYAELWNAANRRANLPQGS
jgi:glycosyltransferase involved in cell wall biosynthesis